MIEWIRRFSGWKNALPLAIALLAIAIRLLAWNIFRDVPASQDWTLYYNPAAKMLASSWDLSLPHDALNISPLYTLFLALAYSLFGDGLIGMRASQSVLDGFAVLGILATGERVFSRRVGLLAAISYALYPISIYVAGLGQPEWLLTLCLVAAILIWIRVRQTNDVSASFALGLLMGAALLLKPNYLLLFPFWFVAEMIFPVATRRRALLNLMVAGAAMVAVTWSWRLIHPAPLNSSSSLVFARIIYMGSVERPWLANGSPMPLNDFYFLIAAESSQRLGSIWDSPETVMQAAFANWFALMIVSPLSFLTFVSGKFAQMWYATDSGTLDRFLQLFQWPLAVTSLSGAVLAVRNSIVRARAFPLFVLLMYTFLGLVLITPLVRELAPISPIVLLFAVFAVDCMIVSWRSRVQ